MHDTRKDRHNLFRFCGLGEGREAAQIAENDRHLAAVTLEKRVAILGRNNEIGDLSGQKPSEPSHPLDRGDLLRHFLFEGSIPYCQPCSLVLKAPRLLFDSVVKSLLP